MDATTTWPEKCSHYNKIKHSNKSKTWVEAGFQTEVICLGWLLLPEGRSSPKEVLAEETPKNCSFRRDSGTGLTINFRPAECTTWVVVLGENPEWKFKWKIMSETEVGGWGLIKLWLNFWTLHQGGRPLRLLLKITHLQTHNIWVVIAKETHAVYSVDNLCELPEESLRSCPLLSRQPFLWLHGPAQWKTRAHSPRWTHSQPGTESINSSATCDPSVRK